MSFNPGKNVGRTSIRVVPDTTRFRQELRRKLNQIERTTSMTVRVDRANVDQARVRESIRRQLDGFRNLAVDVDVNVRKVADRVRDAVEGADIKVAPVMDRITVERLRRDLKRQLVDLEQTLRPTIDDMRLRQQLDHMSSAFDRVAHRLANNIMSPTDAERLRERLHRIKEHIDDVARNRETRIDANPFTAWAAARLSWLTRPRTVEVAVKINQASLMAALTSLAALSGARLSWKWIDSLIDKMKELDRNLPSIIGWTSGITGLVGGIMASIAGLVGLGQGLFSILPAFLTIPGLIMNAAGSMTVLIVALRHSKEELAALSGDMTELGGIIRTTFWDNAREPIVELVKGLMPQLRNSFHELSTGVGEFTAAMARAFGDELANGRLEGIFKGIAEGWRILGTGAEGFAGALVSLSEIAAQYTPRLAAWFVRQANTLDRWLETIAKDGRLGAWMEQAIDSMYDLWDATRGVAGVFSGLWKAAETAGSGGLKGFAEMMLRWREIVNGADFQRGLTAIFRGSYVAMEAFGGAIQSLGRLVADMPDQFERFVGSVGGFIGGLFDQAFQALNNAQVAIGLDGFSAGLDAALEKIGPSLQPIADTFGRFLGLLGDLASTLLPTAFGVIAELMPAIDGIIGAVQDVLPDLASAVGQVATELGPALADFVTAASPLFKQVIGELADALVELAPAIVKLVGVLGDVVEALGGWANNNKEFFDGIKDFFAGGPNMDWISDLNEVIGGNLRNADGFVIPLNMIKSKEDAAAVATAIAAEYKSVLEQEGPAAADAFLRGLSNIQNIPPDLKMALLDALPSLEDFGTHGRAGGGGFSVMAAQGMMEQIPLLAEAGRQGGSSAMGAFGESSQSNQPGALSPYQALQGLVTTALGAPIAWLSGSGTAAMQGFRDGSQNERPNAIGVFSALTGLIRGAIPNPGGLLVSAGHSIMSGLLSGLRSAYESVKSFVSGIATWIANNKGPLSYDRRLLVPAGRAIMSGLDRGLTDGFVDVQRTIRGMNIAIGTGFDGAGISIGGAVTALASSSSGPTVVALSPEDRKIFRRDIINEILIDQSTIGSAARRDAENLAWRGGTG